MKTYPLPIPLHHAVRVLSLLILLLAAPEAWARVILDSFSARIRGGEEFAFSEENSPGFNGSVTQNGGRASQNTTVVSGLNRLNITSSASISANPPSTGFADTSSNLSVTFTVTGPLELVIQGSIFEEGPSSGGRVIMERLGTGRIFDVSTVAGRAAPIDTTIPLTAGTYTFEISVYGELSSSDIKGNRGAWDFTFKLGKPAPVIFLHGIAGSVLKSGADQIWPSILASDVEDLALSPGFPNATAVDVVRKFDPLGIPNLKTQYVYENFLKHMTDDLGYEEFKLEEDRSRLTSTHMLTGLSGEKPTLFTFPYDWRRSNGIHTVTLHQYIQKIRELHDNAKVNIVAHSMGGLLMRRYLLEYGTDDVDKVVTVGSPLLGAVKPFYLLHTGEFYDNELDLTNSNEMITSLATMPGLHELLASPLYLSNTVTKVFAEVGFDLNGNSSAYEDYSTSQLYSRVDALVAPVPSPSQTNQSFHETDWAGRQDNWSADAAGAIKFLHVVGIQQVNRTIVKVLATSVIQEHLIGPPTQSVKFIPVPGEGDGTVPSLSSRRLPQYLAPGAIIREFKEPIPGVTSDLQPAGRSAEHTGLMSNPEVWAVINEFMDTGTLAAPSPAPAGPPPAGGLSDPAPGPLPEALPGDPPEIEVAEPAGTTLVDGIAGRAFGTVNLSSSSALAIYTIRNTGGSDLNGLSVTKDGLNSADFVISNPGSTTVLPGESTTFTVTFAPTVAGGHRGGPRSAAMHIASNDADESPFDISLTGNVTPGRKDISVVGAGYIKFRDLPGNTNTKLSSIVAGHVPGVEVHYGGSKPWVDLSFSADKQLTLENDSSVDFIDIAVTEFDSAGTAFSLLRYRFAPDGHSWQAVVAPGLQPELRVDLDNDTVLAPGETVAAIYSHTGDSVDTTPPTVTMTVTDGPDGIVLNLSGNDGAQPQPIVRFSLDEGALGTYSLPLLFPKGKARTVRAFSEDAVGNTSGMIETTINPLVTIGAGATATINIQWPSTDGWLLEEASTLTGPWPLSTASVMKSGLMNSVSIPLGGPAKFFRLRSTPVTR